MKYTILHFLTLLIFFSCSPQKKNKIDFNQTINSNFTINSKFKKYFDECGVEGSIAIFDNNNQQWILSDTVNVMNESLPASTFKIINLLIALETKTIKNENEIVKWVGKTDTIKYGYRPEIYHDMSVKEAFEVSAGWVFVELAKKIGKENYKKYLSVCNYGNLNLTESNDDFWNFGNFAISPINQVEFIKKLYEEKLPFSKRNIDIVKRIMITEKTEEYSIRAKTGWTRENNINTGWWVGCMEVNNNTYFFATLLLQDRKNNRNDFGSCRKEITKKIFNELGFINNKKEQTKKNTNLFNSIDHIPIVVNDLDKMKGILKNELHFTIKEGKVHEGIKNCFVKFQDGTYLEFLSPTDSLHSIGNYYANFLKTKQGGTSLAISISNFDLVKQMLQEQNIQFNYDSNKVWKTIEPQKFNMFFIEYADKSWKENPVNTNHSNTATELTATYFLTDSIEAEMRKYKSLGISEIESGNYLETPYKLLKIGQSNLYLLHGVKSSKINQLLNISNLNGICGLQIKINSLQTLNKLITQKENIIKERNRTTIYFKDYKMFLAFSE